MRGIGLESNGYPTPESSETQLVSRVTWQYINPFWNQVTTVASPLSPNECRRRLQGVSTSGAGVVREWSVRGVATFHTAGIGTMRFGPIFEMHVRVNVVEGKQGTSLVRLTFSAGPASALVLMLVDIGAIVVFVRAINALATMGWTPLVGAGLLAVIVPALLILAMRAESPVSIGSLRSFVLTTVEAASI